VVSSSRKAWQHRITIGVAWRRKRKPAAKWRRKNEIGQSAIISAVVAKMAAGETVGIGGQRKRIGSSVASGIGEKKAAA